MIAQRLHISFSTHVTPENQGHDHRTPLPATNRSPKRSARRLRTSCSTPTTAQNRHRAYRALQWVSNRNQKWVRGDRAPLHESFSTQDSAENQGCDHGAAPLRRHQIVAKSSARSSRTSHDMAHACSTHITAQNQQRFLRPYIFAGINL